MNTIINIKVNGAKAKCDTAQVTEESAKHSLQQLQAKIADLIEWYDIPISMGLRAVNRAQLVAKLQQLSAVQ